MPRQKIARDKPKAPDRAPVDLTFFAELPNLTLKQHAFVDAILAGHSQARAYGLAFPTATGDERLDRDNNRRGQALAHKPHVSAWIAAARAERASQGAYTLDHAMTQLEDGRRMAARSGNAGAAIQAILAMMKGAGLIRDEVVTTHVDVAELVKALHRLAGPAATEMPIYQRLIRRIEPALIQQGINRAESSVNG